MSDATRRAPDSGAVRGLAARTAGEVKDLGGFSVRRLLPSRERRSVGPFVFFDHFGPARFAPGQGIDVRPHPHIGLATVTYLLEGEILHRDSLGSVQPIRPGAVNWMTAGRGIVHSERSGDEERARDARLHGIQTWIGLPRADEECEPCFRHHPRQTIPERELDGATLRWVAGEAFGEKSPVETLSPLFYLDVALPAGRALELPPELGERGVYVLSGALHSAAGEDAAGRLLVARDGAPWRIEAVSDARLVAFGGQPLDGPRELEWNFVASSRARIERAKRDWREGRFAGVPGDSEFIPLPGG